jgi:hypothetical protein
VQTVVHAHVHGVEVWPVQQDEAYREVATSHIINQRAADVLDWGRDPSKVRARCGLSKFVPIVYYEDTYEERIKPGIKPMPDRTNKKRHKRRKNITRAPFIAIEQPQVNIVLQPLVHRDIPRG